MKLFGDAPDPDSVRLGNVHEHEAEVHYENGDDSWWYHGKIWLAESRPITEAEFSPVLRDPRNKLIIAALKEKGATVEGVARSLSVPTWIVRDVARALETASVPHTVRYYGLKKARKEEERVLVTIDQDLVTESSTVPYTETEKGAKRLRVAMIAGMLIVDAIFMIGMSQVFTLGPSLAYNPGAVTGLAVQWGEIIAFPASILAVAIFMARRTRVLDIRIQPILHTLGDPHTEAVYLVNSAKAPASAYISHILKLDRTAIMALTEEIARFGSDTIDNLMKQVVANREQLDDAKHLSVQRFNQGLDMQMLGRSSGFSGESSNWAAVALVVVIAVAATVLLTWGVTTGGL